jgi:2-dehydro-3-deoxyphosphogluconate aldolase / (4S)-4-hydroxy-2-oxoglutarate aldolase
MARFARLQVYDVMGSDGLVPLFHHGDATAAAVIAAALARGGARLIEFTDRGDGAIDVFTALQAFLAREHPQVILGVGSVSDAAFAALYLAKGANFVVGPNPDAEVARTCNARKVAYLPGCATVGEIAVAESWGVEIVKIFPGFVGGSEFVRALRGPRPWTRTLISGGVSLEESDLRAWFEAGAACVGAGGALIPPGAEADPARLEAATRTALATIRRVRGGG